MAILGSLCPWVNEQYTDDNGDPLAGGFVAFKVTGTASDKDTFSTSDLDPGGMNSNPVELDSAGRPPVAIFLESGGYDINIYDLNLVLIKSIVGVENIAPNATPLVSGARDVTDGYTVQDDDYFITCLGAASPDPMTLTLPAAATRTSWITIKNLGPVGVLVTPDGSDTIEGSLTSWTINTAATPTFFTVTLAPDPETMGNWLIQSSHGF